VHLGIEHVRVGRDFIVQIGAELAETYGGHLADFTDFYLGTDARPKRFGGREALIERLDAWLESPQGRHLLVLGAIGRGKTTLLTHWLARLEGRDSVFVPISIRFSTNSPEAFYSILGSKLADLVGESLNVRGTVDARRRCVELLDQLEGQQRNILVVVDGLDEMGGWSLHESVVRPDRDFVRFLFAGRPRRELADDPSGGWFDELRWDDCDAAVIQVGTLDLAGVESVLESAGLPARDGDVDVAAELMRLSEGDPLLLDYYLGDINRALKRQGRFDWSQLPGLASGFARYFERWLGEQQPYWEAAGAELPQKLEAILAILSCALGPLRHTDLERLLELGHDMAGGFAETHLRHLRRFVINSGGGIVLGHPRLAEHLRSKVFQNGQLVVRSQNAFAQWLRETLGGVMSGRTKPEDTPAYLVQFALPHAVAASAAAADFFALTGIAWLRAWEGFQEAHGGFTLVAASALERMKSRAGPGDPWRSWALCADLVLNSIRNAASIPPEILGAAVAAGALGFQQAMLHLDVANPEERARGLAILLPLAPEDRRERLIAQAAMAARRTEGWRARVRALSAVAHAMPESPERDQIELEMLEPSPPATSMIVWLEAMRHIIPAATGFRRELVIGHFLDLVQDRNRYNYLHYLLPHLEGVERRQVMEAARWIHAEAKGLPPTAPFSGDALVSLFHHLEEEEKALLWAPALDAALAEPSLGSRAAALAAIRPYIRDNERRRGCDRALIAAGKKEFHARLSLMRALPDELPEDQATSALRHGLMLSHELTGTLEELEPLLTPEAIELCFEQAVNGPARSVLAALAPKLRRDQLVRALAACRTFRDMWNALDAVVNLAAHLPETEARQRILAAIETSPLPPQYDAGRAPLLARIPATPPDKWPQMVKVLQHFFTSAELAADWLDEVISPPPLLPPSSSSTMSSEQLRNYVESLTETEALAACEAARAQAEEILTQTAQATWPNEKLADALRPMAAAATRLDGEDRRQTLLFVERHLGETGAKAIAVVEQLLPAIEPALRSEWVDRATARQRSRIDWDAGTLAPLFPLVTAEERERLVARSIELIPAPAPSYYSKVENLVKLCRALTPEERARIRPQVVKALLDFTEDDDPTACLLYEMLPLPLEERREVFERLGAFTTRVPRSRLLEIVAALAPTIAEVEGEAGVRALLAAVSDVTAHLP